MVLVGLGYATSCQLGQGLSSHSALQAWVEGGTAVLQGVARGQPLLSLTFLCCPAVLFLVYCFQRKQAFVGASFVCWCFQAVSFSITQPGIHETKRKSKALLLYCSSGLEDPMSAVSSPFVVLFYKKCPRFLAALSGRNREKPICSISPEAEARGESGLISLNCPIFSQCVKLAPVDMTHF